MQPILLNQTQQPLTIYDLQVGGKYYIEDICKPYVQSVSDFYIIVAVFNICYSVSVAVLSRFKDKMIIDRLFKAEDLEFKIKISVQNIINVLNDLFFLMNFIVFGYWLATLHFNWFIRLPIIKWFI